MRRLRLESTTPWRSQLERVKVEFLFDFGSPNAYLAERVIPNIERRTGVKFAYVPVLLGGILRLTNNRSPDESLAGIKNKPQYMELETERFIRRHNITTFRRNPFFPINTLQLMRGAVAAQFEGVFLSTAARSALRPSSSATKCSSARISCATWRKPSWKTLRRRTCSREGCALPLLNNHGVTAPRRPSNRMRCWCSRPSSAAP